jgi:uncharacterized membrane protein YfcA
MSWLWVVVVGMGVGFVSGLFGKGGSAIATPLLHLVGVPAMVALAAPLPATIPSTLAAGAAYWKGRFIDRQVFFWSLAFGIPATAAGALATRWIGGAILLRVTDVIIALLGLRFLLAPTHPEEHGPKPGGYRLRLAVVATVVGVASGLLANSGGFLLAPLYLTVLRLPIKSAFASSLAVASVLAVPGTFVHWRLGHIDWTLVLVFGAASVPLSYLGARVALRTDAVRLERLYGGALLVLGVVLLTFRGAG